MNEMPQISDFVMNALGCTMHEVSCLFNAAPCIGRLPYIESSHGDKHKFIREVGAPSVGFREPYKGRCFKKSRDEVDMLDLKLLDFGFGIDKGVAATWPKSKGGSQGLLAREGLRHLRQAFFHAEKQFFNGQIGATWQVKPTPDQKSPAGDACGFLGLADCYSSLAAGVANAGGKSKSATETDLTSVYFICRGENNVAGVMIEEAPFSIGEPTLQLFNEPNSPNDTAVGKDGCSQYPLWYVDACTWLGLLVACKHSAKRLANVNVSCPTDGSTPAGVLTDDLIFKCLSKFPAGKTPDLVVMNQAALESLRQSRTATNATGAPAPCPETVGKGIEICVTDSISSCEPQVV